MGYTFLDKFSLLHMAVGILSYFWGMPLVTLLVIHTIFELVENTDFGRDFITNNFTLWPGGKSHADSLVNMVGDTVFVTIGWFVAQQADNIMS